MRASTSPSIVVHTAPVVLPITAAPLAPGAVAVVGEEIIAVGPAAEVLDRFDTAMVREWPGVLLPGLVNAHTHLQYTGFDAVGAHRHADYTAWSIRFVEEYAQWTNGDWRAAAHRGVDQMLAAGITAIADVVTDFDARDVLYERGIPGVAYLELIGLDRAGWEAGAAQRLEDAVRRAPTSPVTTVGLSPHALYSVEPDVVGAVVALARRLGVRLHTHLAESDGEDAFYRYGTGELAQRVAQVTNRIVTILDRGGTGMGAAELAASLGLVHPDTHMAHGVYLGAEGRAMLAHGGSMVALCPRSNHIVGIDAPPVADFLAEDVPFAVGTDSLGSVPSLDLMADVAELDRLALAGGYDRADRHRRILRAATLGGAIALGLDHCLGSLDVGKRADLAVFDLRHAGGPLRAETAEEVLVTAGASRCVATIIGGRPVWLAPQ